MAFLNSSDTDTSTREGTVKGVAYSSLALLVILINSLVLVGYAKKSKKNRGIPDIFVANLAISSIMTSVTVIQIVAYVRMSNNEYFNNLVAACYIQCYFGTALRLIDVATTTCIAIDRFVALWKPIFYRTKVKLKQGCIMCGTIWLVSGLIGLLPIIIDDGVSNEMESLCTADWTKPTAYIVLTFAYVQFIIVLVAYIGIFRCIKAFINRQKAMADSQSVTYNSSTASPTLSKTSKLNRKFIDRSHSGVSFASSISCDDSDSSIPTISNPGFEIELTDKLCKLSQENIKSALNSVKYASNIEVETQLKVRTALDSVPLTGVRTRGHSTSVDLRVKAAINRVSWSTFPDDSRKNENNSDPDDQKKGSNYDPKSKTTIVSTPIYENINFEESVKNEAVRKEDDDVFLKETLAEKKEPSSLGGEKLLRSISSVSVLVRNKLRERRLRRQSSNLRLFWRESQKFAKIMGVVVFIFYLSWIPLAVSYLILWTQISSSTNEVLRSGCLLLHIRYK